MVSLLERCSTWYVGSLLLQGDVGEKTWERLGREAAKGGLMQLVAKREVVRMGRREDLLAVWVNTRNEWIVSISMALDEEGRRRETIKKSDGEEEGWRRIEEMIQ